MPVSSYATPSTNGSTAGAEYAQLNYSQHTEVAQSLPYISRSVTIGGVGGGVAEQNGAGPSEKKTPRTCELEEYARAYEAIQRGTGGSRRRGVAGAPASGSTGPASLIGTITTSRLQQKRLWQRHNSVPEDSALPGDIWSQMDGGRDSVVSNSSNETLRYHDLVNNSASDNGTSLIQPPSEFQTQPYASLSFHPNNSGSTHDSAYSTPSTNGYVSLQPFSHSHQQQQAKDLKRFPLHTYPSQQSLASSSQQSQYADPQAQQENAETVQDSASVMNHSKSVPNLQDQQPSEAAKASPTENAETSFAYLDPEKRLRVSDNTLKLIQKQALLDYYERHSSSTLLRKSSSATNSSDNSSKTLETSAILQVHAEPDSGFYSPTEGRPEKTTPAGSGSGPANGDHPETVKDNVNGTKQVGQETRLTYMYSNVSFSLHDALRSVLHHFGQCWRFFQTLRWALLLGFLWSRWSLL